MKWLARGVFALLGFGLLAFYIYGLSFTIEFLSGSIHWPGVAEFIILFLTLTITMVPVVLVFLVLIIGIAWFLMWLWEKAK